jgi:hypothetical protein
VACPGILNQVETGDTIEIDTDTFTVRNLTNGNSLKGPALPDFYRDMIDAGGEKAYLKRRLAMQT